MTTATSEVLFPDLPVIDSHHHLFDWINPRLAGHLKTQRFMTDDYAAATAGSGHNLIASVTCKTSSTFRADGPPEMRIVGEVEFLNGQAAMAASGRYGRCRVAAGFIASADLTRGAGARAVLEAQQAAAPARFKGVRQEGVWDEDPTVYGSLFSAPEGLFARTDFREGFAHLAPLGLSFDAFVLAPQLADVTALARAFPDTPIVLNHVGSPVGLGRYKDRLSDWYPKWASDMRDIAACPNTSVKLGGLGSFLLGAPFYRADPPAEEAVLVAAWERYVLPAIETFGADRCMFESNMPTDGAGSFGAVCNAFKRMTSGCTPAERADIFAGTAARVYRLGDVAALPVPAPA